MLIDVESVSASRPMKPLFDDLSLAIEAGDRVGVMGINGAGKSTLLRVIVGDETPDVGTVRRRRDLRIATLWQRPDLGTGTVAEAVGSGWRAEAAMDRLGLAEVVDAPVSRLSGGQAKRAALARALLDDEAELLVLDEPTNHLDLDGIEWLERELQAFSGGVVLVSHDRRFLDAVATKLVGIDRGRVRHVSGGYQAYLEAEAEEARVAEAAEASRRILARKELAWLQRGARARRRKPKARIAVATRTLEHVVDTDARAAALAIDEFGAQRQGRRVIDLHDVSFAHPGAPSLFEGLDLSIPPGARLGIVGPNGAGKTSLLDVIAGVLEPTTGSVERGATVRLGYFDQVGRTLDPSDTLEEVVAGRGNRLERQQVALLERFWFEPDTHRAPVSTLSGGELRRLQLLMVLLDEPNLLLLDEPTNDLDLDTLRALEGWLDDWEGSLVAVTHDRVFLERTISEVVAVRDGEVRPLGTGEAVWEQARSAKAPKARRAAAAGNTAPEPKRRSASTLRHLLGGAEQRLADRQKHVEELSTAMEAAVNHDRLAQIGSELAAAEEALVAAEEEWLALAEEAEG